jgi:hypothetical protein
MAIMNRTRALHTLTRHLAVGIALSAALLFVPAVGSASPILLSTVASFGVLGASTVTNTGPTTVAGNVGVSNNSSLVGITGFFGTLANDGPGLFSGTAHQGDAVAILADTQLVGAMTTLSLMGPGTTLPVDLTGLTLAPGVYTVPGGVSNLTGALTLDGLGDANAQWVFQFLDTLITSSGALVNVVNVGSGSGAGLYWNVASSATLGSGTTFEGNILASTSITMNNGVTLGCGRALAHTGAVTLINDSISLGCAEAGLGDSGGLNGAGPSDTPVPVPEPSTVALLASGLFGAATWRRRRPSLQGALAYVRQLI